MSQILCVNAKLKWFATVNLRSVSYFKVAQNVNIRPGTFNSNLNNWTTIAPDLKETFELLRATLGCLPDFFFWVEC